MASAYFNRGALIEGALVTASSGGNLALDNGSDPYQYVTGTLAHTITLPNATSLVINKRFEITNYSTGSVTINNFGGTLLATLTTGQTMIFRVTDISSSDGVWDISQGATGGTAGLSSQESKQFNSASALGYSPTSKRIEMSLEQRGGNFWRARAPSITAKSYPGTAELNGFFYSLGGYASGSALTINERFDIDANAWLSKAALGSLLNAGTAEAADGYVYYVGGVNTGGTAQSTNYQYNDQTNVMTTRQALASARGFPGSFSLNGVMLVFSGLGSGYTDATSEYFDNTNNVWRSRTDVSYASRSPRGFVLNGKGYSIAGTQLSGPIAFTSVFDHSLNFWTTGTNSLNNGRQNHAAFAMNGCGYAAGGEANPGPVYSTTVEQFTPDTGAWRARANMPQNGAFGRQPSGKSVFGTAITTGGTDSSSASTNTDQYFDCSLATTGILFRSFGVPSSVQASVLSQALAQNLPVQIRSNGEDWFSAYSNGAVTRLSETVDKKFAPVSRVYTIGGAGGSFSNIDRYDAYLNSWSTRGNMPLPGDGYGTFSFGGKTHLVSGDGTTNNYLYDELTNSTSTKAAITQAQTAGGSYNQNDFGYAVGGFGTSVTVNNNSQYNPTLDSWSAKAVYPSTVYDPASCSLGGLGFMFSGTTSSNGSLAGLTTASYKYDDVANAWTAIASIGTAALMKCVPFQDYAVIYGLWSAGNVNNVTVYEYKPSTNAYTTLANYGLSSSYPGVARYRGEAYALGGYNNPGGNTTGSAKYNRLTNTWSSIASLTSARYRGMGSCSFTGSSREFEVRVGIPAWFAGVGANTWLLKSPMARAQYVDANFTLGDRVYGAIGLDNPPNVDPSTRTNVVQRYDYAIDTWTFDTNFGPGIGDTGGHSTTNALFGKGYGVGFNAAAGTLAPTSVVFDPDLHVWSSIANLPVNSGAGNLSCAANGYMYNNGNHPSIGGTLMHQYDPSANSWATKTSSSGNHYSGGGASRSGYMYSVGGTSSTSNERYVDMLNAWQSRTAIPSGVNNIVPMSVEEGFLIPGGYTGVAISTVQKYYEDLNAWKNQQSLPVATYGASTGRPNGNGMIFGGSNGSVYLATTYLYANSVKNAVLSAGITVA